MTFLSAEKGPELTDTEFRIFADLVRSHCGLHFAEDARFLLQNRLARRLHELELNSFSEYHFRIRNGGVGEDELPNLIDELTTNETYFFREYSQLRALVHEILPELQSNRGSKDGPAINIWSAGCSSGEEPYTIAMLAREAGLQPGVDLRIYASDISRRVLRKARQGAYRETSFRETDPALRDRYFLEKNRVWQIRDEIKRDVDFIHLNLLDRSKIALLGTMDVILCRNVIIYFDLETKCRIIQMFYEKLRPGAHLLLGHSESLINLSTSFELRHLRNDLVYRRPLPGLEPRDPWHIAAEIATLSVDDPISLRSVGAASIGDEADGVCGKR
jgi:chemotaxis protein methyltransferase CheR